MKKTKEALHILVLLSDNQYSCTGHGIIKALSVSTLNYRLFCISHSDQKAGIYMTNDRAISPAADDEHYVDWILDFCIANKIDILLPDDVGALLFVEHRTFFKALANTYVLTCPPHLIHIAENKLLTSQWLEANGFAFPAYAMANSPDKIDALIQQKSFPLFAKPIHGRSSVDCFVIRDLEDLRKAQQKENYIIQEYLGSKHTEYTAACFVDRDGICQGTIAMRRYLHEGASCYCEVVSESSVLEECERIAMAIGARGTINIQLRMHQGQAVCFEINPRFSSTTGIRAQFGFNDLEHTIRHYCLGQPAKDLPKIRKGRAIRYSEAILFDLDPKHTTKPILAYE